MEDDELAQLRRERDHAARELFAIVTDVETRLAPLRLRCDRWQLASMLCMGAVVAHIVATAITGAPTWLWWMAPWIAGGLFTLWRSQRAIKAIRVVMNELTERTQPGPPAARYDPLHERHTE